jgi:hypothetical protein
VFKELLKEGDFIAKAMIFEFDGVKIAFVSLTAGLPILLLIDMRRCYDDVFQRIATIVN